jgi:4-nitrophenyl phosphatase
MALPAGDALDTDRIEFVLCDLDGVVWLDRTALPGAVSAVDRLRDSGRRVVFVTNNSMSTIAVQEEALGSIGVPAVGDVVTSAQAAASLIAPACNVLVCGGAGVIEAVETRHARVVDAAASREAGVVDAVIVGLHHDFDYQRLQDANRAIRAGARFIATNDDATFPTPDGPTPGAGAIVAAVATASGATPEYAGKPYPPMAALVAERCGVGFSASAALMVGDRWSTDGRFAATLGCAFALVRTGVTPPGAAIGGAVSIDAADLASVVDLLVG